MLKDDYLEWSEKKQMGFLSHRSKVSTNAAVFSCDHQNCSQPARLLRRGLLFPLAIP